jgi:hypothetical protein
VNYANPEFEHRLLLYFVHDEWAALGFQHLSSIWEQIQSHHRADRFFDEIDLPPDKNDLKLILERMSEEGLIRRWQDSSSKEPSYFATEQALDAASSDDALLNWVIDSGVKRNNDNDASSDIVNDSEFTKPSPSDDARAVNEIDSTQWTGLPKVGILGPDAIARIQIGLRLVDQAIQQFDGSNEERAKARAYFIAIQALAEAPEPPADLIWQIISRANSVSGIASLFIAMVALFQAAAH